MAYATGTAANYLDLFNKLKQFLTTNAALVSAGQNWSQVWSAPVGAPNTTDVVLSGPGLSGTDSVLVGLSLVADVPNDRFAIKMRGMTGVLANANAISGHVGVSNEVGFYADSNPMTYHFMANGRRFMVVVKIATVFEAAYAGFFLPYALPANYPYPMFIGGTHGYQVRTNENSWRSVVDSHSHFTYPHQEWLGGGNGSTSAYMLDPLGQWLPVANLSGGDVTTPHCTLGPQDFGDQQLDVSYETYYGAMGYNDLRRQMTTYFGGGMALTPITIVQDQPQNQCYGILQGAFHCPGVGNASENIITSGGVNHLAVQNVFRTDIGSLWAAALE